jgi:flagellar assembly protein FliH
MSDIADIDKKNTSEKVEAKPYELDMMELTNVSEDETNALGYAKDWYSSAKIEEETPPDAEEEKTGQITLEEIEVIRKDAYDDGFNEGKKEGYDAGFALGHEEGVVAGRDDGFNKGREEGIANGTDIVTKEAARLSKFTNHLVKPIADFDKEISSEMIYLASRLTRAFIKQELSSSYEYLEKSVSEICRLLPIANAEVTLSLNPKDVQLLKNIVVDPNIKIISDPNLKQGDLRAESAMSSIDVRLEERIDNFLTEFLSLNIDRALDSIKDNGFAEDTTYKDVVVDNPVIENPPKKIDKRVESSKQLHDEIENKSANENSSNTLDQGNSSVVSEIVESDDKVSSPVTPKQGGITIGPKKL